jgi:hypothetical protein
VAGFLSAADKTKLDGVAASANNYVAPNHTGDVTSLGDGATAISNDAVTNAKLANVTSQTIKGRATSTTGDPEDLTAAQVRSILNVADGAEVNVNADWNATTGDAAILNKPVLNGIGPSFTSINWQAGAHFGGTLSFNTTITFQNVVVGKTITVEITGYAQFGVNWPSGITWLSGSAPSITDGATTYFRILATSGSAFLGEAFNPMTAQDKTKLNGIATGAEVNVAADWNATTGDAQILNKPSTFAPSAHTHDDRYYTETEVDAGLSALQTEINGKAAISLAGSPIELVIACSDETSFLTAGTAKVTFRAPVSFTLTSVASSLTEASTSGAVVVDINRVLGSLGSPVSLLTNKLSIDANETTSGTAAVPATFSNAPSALALVGGDQITVDIDQAIAPSSGKGLKVTLRGTRT